jgi:hypothetical protein
MVACRFCGLVAMAAAANRSGLSVLDEGFVLKAALVFSDLQMNKVSTDIIDKQIQS